MNLLCNFTSAFSLGCLQEDDIAVLRSDTNFLFCFCFEIGEVCRRSFIGKTKMGQCMTVLISLSEQQGAGSGLEVDLLHLKLWTLAMCCFTVSILLIQESWSWTKGFNGNLLVGYQSHSLDAGHKRVQQQEQDGIGTFLFLTVETVKCQAGQLWNGQEKPRVWRSWIFTECDDRCETQVNPGSQQEVAS